MWLLEKGGSGMNKYKEALRRMYELLGKIPYEVELSDLNPLSELVNEKLEQESRKDKLVVGSKWECVCKTYGKVKIIDIHPLSKTVTFRNMLFSQTEKIDDFILCFKPIKEGE